MNLFGIFGPVPQTPSIASAADGVGLTQSGTSPSPTGGHFALPTDNSAHTAADWSIIRSFARVLTSCAVLNVGRQCGMRDADAFRATPFVPKCRDDARYCSAACRQRACRARYSTVAALLSYDDTTRPLCGGRTRRCLGGGHTSPCGRSVRRVPRPEPTVVNKRKGKALIVRPHTGGHGGKLRPEPTVIPTQKQREDVETSFSTSPRAPLCGGRTRRCLGGGHTSPCGRSVRRVPRPSQLSSIKERAKP